MGQLKKTLTLRVDYKEQFDLLNTEEKVELLEALFCYADSGEIHEMSNIVKMAFTFIRQQMDDEDEAYRDKCEKNRENVLKRYAKKEKSYDGIRPYTKDTTVYDGIRPNTTEYDRIQSYTTEEIDESGINTEVESDLQCVDDDGFVNIDDDVDEITRKKEAKKENIDINYINNNNQTKEKENTPPISPSKRKRKVFVKPTEEEVDAYCQERGNGITGAEFIASNEAKGWVVGKYQTPMKDWKAAIRTWEQNRGFHYEPKPKDSPPKIPDRYADYQ